MSLQANLLRPVQAAGVFHIGIRRPLTFTALRSASTLAPAGEQKIFDKNRTGLIASFLGRLTGLFVTELQHLHPPTQWPLFVYANRAGDVLDMGRPRRMPESGDVVKAVVASRLGLSVPEFEGICVQLEARGFPRADETTGRYAIEAVDAWRLRRYPDLFPELTAAPTSAVDAKAVFHERIRRFRGRN